MSSLFLGFTTRPRIDWEQFFSEPEAPGNVTKAETAARKIEEAKAKRREIAGITPFSATISGVAVLDAKGAVLFEGVEIFGTNSRFGAVSANLVRVLAAENSLDFNGIMMYGFNIGRNLKIMAVDVMCYNGLVGAATAVAMPPDLWYHPTFEAGPWLDPYEALVSGPLQRELELAGLCQLLGLDVPADLFTNPRAQATLARELTFRAQLADPC